MHVAGESAFVGVGFPLDKISENTKQWLPRWMLQSIRQVESVESVAKTAFAAKQWLRGYGRYEKHGLPVTKTEDTKEPAWATEILFNPNHKFWNETADRKADRDDALKNPLFSRATHTDLLAPVKTVVNAAGDAIDAVTSAIPVVGDVTSLLGNTFLAPVKIVADIASGTRLDQVAVNALKSQISQVRGVAPYAQTVLSVIPGIGTGAAAMIAAGAKLAEGASITDALKAGIRGAIPGGAIAQAAFDTALKAAAGENIGVAALEGARNLVPDGPARKAFDIGVAVATGEKLQDAVANGLLSLAPAQLASLAQSGVQAISKTPGMAEALKSVTAGKANDAFKLAAGLLAQKGVNEKAVQALRSKLEGEAVKGFDAALRTQAKKIAWLNDVIDSPQTPPVTTRAGMPPTMRSAPAPKTAAPATAPPPLRAPPVKAAPAPAVAPPPLRAAAQPVRAPVAMTSRTPATIYYPPYPSVGVSDAATAIGVGWLSGCGASPDSKKWGPPITDMDSQMRWAGLSAVKGTIDQRRMAEGPDGTYLFSMENGALTARKEIT